MQSYTMSLVLFFLQTALGVRGPQLLRQRPATCVSVQVASAMRVNCGEDLDDV